MGKRDFGIFSIGLDVNWLVRLILPVFVFAISGILLYYGIFFELGWAIGVLLLLFGGRSRSEKNGYRF